MADGSTPSSQIEAINLALAEFYRLAAASVQSYGLPPNFAEYTERLNYDELLRRAEQDYNGSAGPSTAIAVEEIHTAVAHTREHILATRTKAVLYAGIISEYAASDDYHKDRAVLFKSILDGNHAIPYLA